MQQHKPRQLRWAELRKWSEELVAACNQEGETEGTKISLLRDLQNFQTELERIDLELHVILRELQSSHQRYSDLYDHAPVSYLTLSDNDLILEANRAACDLLKSDKNSLLGYSVTDFIPENSQELFRHHKTLLKTTNDKQSCELTLQTGDNTVFDAQLTSVVIPSTVDDDWQIWIIITNITKSKQAALELQDHAQSLSELNKLLQLSQEELSTEDLYSKFLNAILSFERLGASKQGLIYLLENKRLILKASVSVPNTINKQCAEIALGECLCGKAAQLKQVIFADSDDKDHITRRQSSPHAHYCVPILTQESHVLGVLTLFLNYGTPYSEKIERILVASSQVIASIINKNRVKDELRERTEMLSSIYSSADSIALIVADLIDNDAKISQFSPGAETMFGYLEKEMLGQSVSCLYQKEDKHFLPKRIQTLLQGNKVQSLDITMRKKDGTPFSVVVTITPLAEKDGGINRALGVFNDVSELKHAQLELEQANTALEKRVTERTQELQAAQQQVLHAEKLAAVGKLSASIAHEFNSPLQGVMSVLKGVAKRATLEDEDAHLINSAVGECGRMAHLIRDLQDFNRPSSGRRSWVNMHQILDSTLLLYKSDFRRRQILVHKLYAQKLPTISVVPDQIRQVVLNLLNNAVDACENGGKISIETRMREETIMLIISDNGQGIEQDNLQQIFEPFYTTKPAVKGTGLGLSVCYGIIKSHQGSIEVESKPHHGTTFFITLPIKGNAL